MSWDEVCKGKNEGGLGVGDINLFNVTLIRKWVWRVLENKENLWVRMIESRYGSLGRECRGWERARASIWWRDLSRIFWGSNGDGLRGDFVRELGSGDNIFFTTCG